MIALEIKIRESNSYKKIENLVEKIKVNCIIKPLQNIFYNEIYEEKFKRMKNAPKHSIGNDIANMLHKNDLKIIPKFENHDLKHLILGYEMTTQDEIKMQAYLLGNGNRSISCLLFLFSGILFPLMWKEYYIEFKKGQKSPSILNLSIDDCMEMPTKEIKEKYKKY